MNYDFDQLNDRRNTYSTQWDYIEDRFHQKDLLPFSISDTDFQVPGLIIEDLQTVLDHRIFGYSRWNHQDYKSAITYHYQSRLNTLIDEEWLAYSPSVLYSISVLLRLLTEKNDQIVVFDPMYDAFINVIQKNQRELVAFPLNEDKIDFAALEKKLSTAKIFLLCSPHNPTGRVFTQEELAVFIEVCRKCGVTIISDEIHSDVILFNHRHHPILQWQEAYQKLILVSSASKTFNIPALGGSYAIIADPKLYKAFLSQTREKDFVNSPNIMGMIATMSAYRKGTGYIDQLIPYIEENMILLHTYLQRNLPQLHFSLPAATYLAWIDTRQTGFSDVEIQEALVKVGKVGIMAGRTYGTNGKGFLRMNVGCPKSKLAEGLQRMKRSFDYLSGENYVK